MTDAQIDADGSLMEATCERLGFGSSRPWTVIATRSRPTTAPAQQTFRRRA